MKARITRPGPPERASTFVLQASYCTTLPFFEPWSTAKSAPRRADNRRHRSRVQVQVVPECGLSRCSKLLDRVPVQGNPSCRSERVPDYLPHRLRQREDQPPWTPTERLTFLR